MKKLMFFMYVMGFGGAEKQMLYLLEGVDRNKYEPVVLCALNKGELLERVPEGVKIRFIQEGDENLSYYKLVYSLRRIILEEKPDIICSRVFGSNMAVHLALSSLPFRKKPKTVFIEASYPEKSFFVESGKFKPLKKYLLSSTYKNADRVIALTHQSRESLIRFYKLKGNNIDVIYSGLDIEQICKMAASTQNYNLLDENYFNLVAVGTLKPYKGLEALIKAMLVIEESKRIRLCLLGKGPLEDSLRKMVTELKLEDRVIFLGYNKNPYQFMYAADAFILASEYEGMPNCLLEAMALGKPVISTDCPSGPREIIKDRENGMLIPVNDIPAILDSINYLYEDKALMKKLGENAQNDIKQHFSKHVMISNYDKVFNNV